MENSGFSYPAFPQTRIGINNLTLLDPMQIFLADLGIDVGQLIPARRVALSQDGLWNRCLHERASWDSLVPTQKSLTNISNPVAFKTLTHNQRLVCGFRLVTPSSTIMGHHTLTSIRPPTTIKTTAVTYEDELSWKIHFLPFPMFSGAGTYSVGHKESIQSLGMVNLSWEWIFWTPSRQECLQSPLINCQVWPWAPFRLDLWEVMWLIWGETFCHSNMMMMMTKILYFIIICCLGFLLLHVTQYTLQ